MKTTYASPRTAPSFPVPLWLIFSIGVIAVSFSSIFVKWSQAPVSVLAMYRLYFTNLILLPFIWKYKEELSAITPRMWLGLFFSGSMLGLHFLLWMGSLRYTSVASSTAIGALQPVLVMIGAYWCFKQTVRWQALTSMLTAIVGAVWIGWGDFGLSATALLGDALSFVGTIAIAVSFLLGQQLRSHLSALVYSFFVFFFAANVLAIYNLAAGYSFWDYPAKEWRIFLLLAAVPTLFGHFLFNWLLKYMSATSVSMSILGEPLAAAVLAFFLLGETLTWMQIWGGTVLLISVAIFLKQQEKK